MRTLMGGTLAGQLVVFAVTPLLTRLYSPEAFNDFGLYMALSGIFSVLATLRLEAAVPIARSDTDAVGLTRLSMQSSMGVAVIAALSTALALHLGWFASSTHPWGLAAVVGVSVWLIGAFQSLTALSIRRDEFGQIAKAKTTQGLWLAVGQVGLGLLNPSSLAFTAGDAAGRLAGLGQLYGGYRQAGAQPAVLVTTSGLALLREYRQFPLFSMPAAGINALGAQAPILLLGLAFAPTLTGLYVFANRLVAVPVGLIARTLSQVYIGEVGKVQAKGGTLQPVLTRYLLAALMASGVGAGLVLLTAPWLVPWLFGTQWLNALPVLNALLVMAVIQVPASSVSQTLNATGHNHWQLIWDTGRLLAVVLAFVVAHQRELDLPQTVWLYAAVSAACYTALIAAAYASLKRPGQGPQGPAVSAQEEAS
ncbi:lipopolysaccharide biosynthesis protein [Deinococcus rhizophilus]|nr:lipopolysaccharide biosynthesis protein [Deinococcus rhizophilus]